MPYELRAPADLDPLDHMIAPAADGSGRVIVAVPDTADAIANLQAAGFTVDTLTVLDGTSYVG